MKKQTSVVALLAAGLLLMPVMAETKTLPAAAGVRGGLALVLGATDVAALRQFVAGSALYVQALQPDAKLATAWGAAVATSPEREQIGVRQAAFDPAHYGSAVFNLIVVEDAAALGGAKLAEICRILVPRGCVAFRQPPAAFAAAAGALGMESFSAGAYARVYRKPVAPITWKQPLETKWLAGPRSQIANGFKGVCCGNGKLFYLEQMERDEGNLDNSAAMLFARDAYNGRTLWTRELPGGYTRSDRIDLAANSRGRVFAKASTGQVMCIDGDTGQEIFEVTAKANEFARLSVLNDEFLSISGDIRSAESGKSLWTFPSHRYQPLPGTVIGTNIYFCDGAAIFAKQLATGQDVWRVSTNVLPRAVGPGALSRAEGYLLVRMAGAKDEVNIALMDSATGKLLWTYTWKVRVGNEKYFSADNVRSTTVDGKLLLYYRHNQPGVYADEVVGTKLALATGTPEFEDKINKDAGDFHGCFPELILGDYIAWYDIWVNKKTWQTAPGGVPHPACFFGMSSAYGMIFNFPSRKSGPISAVGPADTVLETQAPVSKPQICGRATATAATAAGDWPMFRGGAAGGNATQTEIGANLDARWETQVGKGAADFGIMSSQRTGLTQATLAYGLAVVSDIDGQRIVALDASGGQTKWVYHTGCRVDYPPTLYKGLCLAAGRDGWVHAVDAATGAPVYRLRIAPHERLIAGREKLESRWPLASDVLIVNGVAYVSGGGGDGLAFNPESGEVVAARDPGRMALGMTVVPGGRDLQLSYDMVLKGNSIPRTNEDNTHGFSRGKFGRRLDARVMAFDDNLTVAYQFTPAGEGWANRGTLRLTAFADDLKQPVWSGEPQELVVDDMVLGPQHVYVAGHYQRVKKGPELWVLSRKDGRVLKTLTVPGLPAFLGLSAAGNRLFVSTRDGKLICYGEK